MHYVIKPLAFFVLSITLLNCSNVSSEKIDSSIIVKLENSIDGKKDFFHTGYTDFHFKSYYLDYPSYYENLLKFKGIPNSDTFLLANYFLDKKKFLYELYKENYISDSLFALEIENYSIDTTNYVNSKTKDGLTVFVGIDEGNQILIVDENHNRDFGDDIKLISNMDSVDKSIRSFEEALFDFNYEVTSKGGLKTKYTRKVSIFPAPNHPYTNFYSDDPNKKFHVMGKFRDFWQGSFDYENTRFEVFCQGFNKDIFQILIKPDSMDFIMDDVFYNKNFEYHIKDTIFLSNHFFKIDSINNTLSQLYLTRTGSKKMNIGFRIGQKLENLRLDDLDNNGFVISEVSCSKKYTLLDFWGTWCAPCKKTLPELKVLSHEKEDVLNVLSLAFDDNQEIVEKFVEKNQMNWKHAFIERRYDAPIIKKLRIEVFPTFILIDSDNKIIFRNSGVDGLLQIKEFLDSEQRHL